MRNNGGDWELWRRGPRNGWNGWNAFTPAPFPTYERASRAVKLLTDLRDAEPVR